MSDTDTLFAIVDGSETPPEQLKPGETFAGVLFRPRQTFERLRDAERGHWWIVVLLTIIALSFALIVSASNTFNNLQDFVPPEGMELPEGATTEMPDIPPTAMAIGIMTTAVFGVIWVLIKYSIGALLIFGLSFIFGGKVTFKQTFTLYLWAMLPLVLRYLMQGIAGLVTGGIPLNGLSGVMSTEEALDMSFFYTLLGKIDFYMLWSMLLLTLGVSATTRLEMRKILSIIGVYLVVVFLTLLVGNLISQALANTFGGLAGPM